MAETLLDEGLVHLVASDAHGVHVRRPLLRRAYERIAARIDESTANELCSRNPALIAAGRAVAPGRRAVAKRRHGWWRQKAGATAA
jgi:protein-tyrosine phosphatase